MRYEDETGNSPWNDEGPWRAGLAWPKTYVERRSPITLDYATDIPIPGDPTPCTAEDPELWFNDRTVEFARSRCRACWMQRDCADYGLQHPEMDGVWGALSKAQRRR